MLLIYLLTGALRIQPASSAPFGFDSVGRVPARIAALLAALTSIRGAATAP